MFGADLSYMIKQHKEYFTEEKHLLDKPNIPTHQKKGREATENLVKEEVKITDNVCKVTVALRFPIQIRKGMCKKCYKYFELKFRRISR